jgi:hypothetical protein
MNMDFTMQRSEKCKRGAALGLAALLCSLPFSTDAQDVSTKARDSQPRVVVLQSDDQEIDEKFRREVDRLTLKAMAARADFANAYVSPVPFEDVELAAGCSGRDSGCLQRIAATLDADWIMVRALEREPSGRTYLTLVAHDGPIAIVTRRAVAELSTRGDQTPDKVVPLLVERLYPRETHVPSAATPRVLPKPRFVDDDQATRRRASPAKIVGWTSAAAGGALLAAGVVVGALARNDQRKHEALDVSTKPAADQASDLFSRAQRRTDIANGLMLGGAGAGTVGVAALLWDALRPKSDKRLSVRVAPVRSGVALALRTSFRGGF